MGGRVRLQPTRFDQNSQSYGIRKVKNTIRLRDPKVVAS